MSLDLFAEFYRKNSAEYKLAKRVHEATGKNQDCGNGLRWLPDEDDTIEHWFDGDFDTATEFYAIAATPSSGLFAVWILDGVKRKDMPFVFLGGEGDAHVIADNFAEFLSLIAVPYDDIEFAFSNLILEPDDAPEERFLRFQKQLAEQCDIQPASSPKTIVENAQSKHPSLSQFVEEWADRWFKQKKSE